MVGELLQKVLTFAESSLRTGILYIHQPTSALRKSLNSKIHLILSFPEFKVFKLTQKFLDPGGNMIKKGIHTNSLTMYPGILIFPRVPFNTEMYLWNTMLLSRKDLLYSDN